MNYVTWCCLDKVGNKSESWQPWVITVLLNLWTESIHSFRGYSQPVGELRSWGNVTIWWRQELVMVLCCHITLLPDSFPRIWAPAFHSLSSGSLQHELTVIICFGICEGEGGTLQAVGNIFQSFSIPSVR